GLYYSDQRFGPGVVTYPDGRQDVGFWLGQRLLKLCSSVEEGFSLHSFPQYATFMQSSVTEASLIQGLHGGAFHCTVALTPGHESLHVLPVHVWVLSGYSGFLPQSKNMTVRFIGLSQLPLGMNGCVRGRLSCVSLCCPAMDW
ncbi:hypothetical protein ILYODFUR_037753, partial [Ilyodon furcidens]